MRFAILGWMTAALVWTAPGAAGAEEAPDAVPRLGINLSGPVDWNTELPFVDVFRLSRTWISQREGAAWGGGPPLELDEHGWVTRLEPGAYAETLLCTIEGGRYPAGRYTLLYEGEGRIEVANAASAASRGAGRMELEVDPGRGAMFLQIRETDPENYIRNIRVIMPGFEETHDSEPWHPAFLHRWSGMACLRFMDFMHTNHSEIETWDTRPEPADANATERGVPLEWMIDLCNRLGADPWFCMPHRADDDYVRQFALMTREMLGPDRKVYVEYSNEVWNGIFSQHQYAAERGQALGFAEQPWEAAWRYTARRSVEIFAIWEKAFSGTERLVRVLATQAANAYVSRRIVEFEDAYQHADALGVAPYISMNLSPGGDPSSDEVAGWTVDQALDYVEQTALPESIRWMREQKEVADEFGLQLAAYEAGQHLVGVGGGENNDRLTALLHEANRHPRMGDIYQQYYQAWEEEGGGLLCHFSSISEWSKWGSWGLMEHYDSDPANYPKFGATLRWGESLGQPVNVPGSAVAPAGRGARGRGPKRTRD